MNCLGCNSSNWEYPDVSIARCKNCGYLLDPYAFGLKSSPSSTNPQRSENSKRWAKIVFSVSILIFVVSIWIPDWFALGVIGLAASLVLMLDSLMYS
jgi:hypothetical protein